MELTITLPTEDEMKLRQRANAAGEDLAHYVERLVTRELAAPLSLAEAAEPLARAVDAAGATEDEFTQALIDAREAARRDRRHRV